MCMVVEIVFIQMNSANWLGFKISPSGECVYYFGLHDLFIKNEDAPCYAQPIHGKGILTLGHF